MIKRGTKICVEWLIGFLVGLMIIGGTIVWRLQTGPVALPFLKATVVQALAIPQAGVQWRIDSLDLVWDAQASSPALRLSGLRAFNAADDAVATIPELAVGVSLRALIVGRFAPSSITVLQPALTLTRDQENHWQVQSLALKDNAMADGASAAPDFMADVLQSFIGQQDAKIPFLRYLRRVSVRGGEVLVDDRHRAATFWLPELNMELVRNRQGLSGKADLEVELDESRTQFQAQIVWPQGANTAMITTQFAALDVGRMVQLVPEFAEFARMKTTIAGSLQFTVSTDGGLTKIDLVARSDQAELNHAVYFPTPVTIQGLDLRADYTPLGGLQVSLLSGTIMGAKLQLSGTLAPQTDGFATVANVELSDLDLRHLAALWPADVAPKPRAWVVPNIAEGRVSRATVNFKGTLPPNRDTAELHIAELTGAMDFNGAVIDYLSPLPKATGVNGRAEFDADTMTITTTSGTAGGMTLGDGKTVIGGLSAVDQTIVIDMAARGEIADILRILDHEPLRLPSKKSIRPDQFTGDATANAKLSFPLLKDLLLEQISIDVKGQGTDVGMTDALWGQPMQRGNLTVAVTQDGMEIAGDGVLADTPFNLLWQEDFRDRPTGPRSRYVVSATGQVESALTMLGLDLPIPISGIASVDVDYRIATDRSADALIQADLTNAAAALPEANYWKPAGQRGTARVEMAVGSAGKIQRLRQFTFAANDVAIEGKAEFDNAQELQRLEITKLKTAQNDAQLILKQEGKNSYAINVWGSKFDAGYLWDAPPDDDATTDNYTIDFNLGRLSMGGTDQFQQAKGRIVKRGKVTESLRFSALTGAKGDQPLSATITPSPAGRRILVQSPDAGGVLRALNVYDTMRSGALTVEGVYRAPDRDELAAVLRINNFTITDAPILGQLLNLSSLPGILQNLSGQGINFDKFTADFVQLPGLMTIKTARLNGASIGIKVSGTIDTHNDSFDLNGTLAPANALNKVIAEIPLIGGILTMGGEQPLFGFNFSIKDRIDQPKISVNPLSALTPGILREVFGGN